jgi:hypothetical protein
VPSQEGVHEEGKSSGLHPPPAWNEHVTVLVEPKRERLNALEEDEAGRICADL